MSFVAAAVGVSAVTGLVSGVMGSNAAKSAANVQAGSAANALAFQKQAYGDSSDYIKSTLSPYITAGNNATGKMSALNNGDFSSFYQSPDYQFALQQGNRGVTNYENSTGMGMSGGALKDISQFNQGLATQNYGNYYNRLMQLGQMGAGAAGSAAGGIGSLSGVMSGQIGNTTMGMGQAQASGIVGSTNAITGSMNGVANNALLASLIGNKNPSAYQSSSFLQPGSSVFGSSGPTSTGGPNGPSPLNF